RIDLQTRRAEPWCLARIDAFAPTTDGSLWFVADRDAVLALDVLDTRFRALWRVDKLGGRVLAVARSPRACTFAVEGDPIERWRYALPSPTLRDRAQLPERPPMGPIGVAAEGLAAAMAPLSEAMPDTVRLLVADGKTPLHRLGFVGEAPAAPPA